MIANLPGVDVVLVPKIGLVFSNYSLVGPWPFYE